MGIADPRFAMATNAIDEGNLGALLGWRLAQALLGLGTLALTAAFVQMAVPQGAWRGVGWLGVMAVAGLLAALVTKTDTIRKELGSLSQVLEQKLLGALQAVDPTIREVRGVSRTDTGVHAWDQRVAFDLAPVVHRVGGYHRRAARDKSG